MGSDAAYPAIFMPTGLAVLRMIRCAKDEARLGMRLMPLMRPLRSSDSRPPPVQVAAVPKALRANCNATLTGRRVELSM